MNRKDLKAAYKQNWFKLRKMGVYQIRNNQNGKAFLDGSLNLEGTLERDRSWLALGGFPNARLQNDWHTFGPDVFTFEVLETLTPTDNTRDYKGELELLLQAWLEKLEPYDDWATWIGRIGLPRREDLISMNTYLEPTFESGRALVTRSIAPPTPISGEEAFSRYVDHAMPYLLESGGDLLFQGQGGEFLIGPEGERWDLAMLVRHRSVQNCMAFAKNEAYLAGIGHRTPAVEDSRLLPLSMLSLPV